MATMIEHAAVVAEILKKLNLSPENQIYHLDVEKNGGPSATLIGRIGNNPDCMEVIRKIIPAASYDSEASVFHCFGTAPLLGDHPVPEEKFEGKGMKEGSPPPGIQPHVSEIKEPRKRRPGRPRKEKKPDLRAKIEAEIAGYDAKVKTLEEELGMLRLTMTTLESLLLDG